MFKWKRIQNITHFSFWIGLFRKATKKEWKRLSSEKRRNEKPTNEPMLQTSCFSVQLFLYMRAAFCPWRVKRIQKSLITRSCNRRQRRNRASSCHRQREKRWFFTGTTQQNSPYCLTSNLLRKLSESAVSNFEVIPLSFLPVSCLQGWSNEKWKFWRKRLSGTHCIAFFPPLISLVLDNMFPPIDLWLSPEEFVFQLFSLRFREFWLWKLNEKKMSRRKPLSDISNLPVNKRARDERTQEAPRKKSKSDTVVSLSFVFSRSFLVLFLFCLSSHSIQNECFISFWADAVLFVSSFIFGFSSSWSQCLLSSLLLCLLRHPFLIHHACRWLLFLFLNHFPLHRGLPPLLFLLLLFLQPDQSILHHFLFGLVGLRESNPRFSSSSSSSSLPVSSSLPSSLAVPMNLNFVADSPPPPPPPSPPALAPVDTSAVAYPSAASSSSSTSPSSAPSSSSISFPSITKTTRKRVTTVTLALQIAALQEQQQQQRQQAEARARKEKLSSSAEESKSSKTINNNNHRQASSSSASTPSCPCLRSPARTRSLRISLCSMPSLSQPAPPIGFSPPPPPPATTTTSSPPPSSSSSSSGGGGEAYYGFVRPVSTHLHALAAFAEMLPMEKRKEKEDGELAPTRSSSSSGQWKKKLLSAQERGRTLQPSSEEKERQERQEEEEEGPPQQQQETEEEERDHTAGTATTWEQKASAIIIFVIFIFLFLFTVIFIIIFFFCVSVLGSWLLFSCSGATCCPGQHCCLCFSSCPWTTTTRAGARWQFVFWAAWPVRRHRTATTTARRTASRRTATRENGVWPSSTSYNCNKNWTGWQRTAERAGWGFYKSHLSCSRVRKW